MCSGSVCKTMQAYTNTHTHMRIHVSVCVLMTTIWKSVHGERGSVSRPRARAHGRVCNVQCGIFFCGCGFISIGV